MKMNLILTRPLRRWSYYLHLARDQLPHPLPHLQLLIWKQLKLKFKQWKMLSAAETAKDADAVAAYYSMDAVSYGRSSLYQEEKRFAIRSLKA